jgi:hypothetical protein
MRPEDDGLVTRRTRISAMVNTSIVHRFLPVVYHAKADELYWSVGQMWKKSGYTEKVNR